MRDPDVFRPPFVSEVDEPQWDDCVVCSTLMLVSAWTLGKVTDSPTGPVMTRPQLKVLREQMRDHLGARKQVGGLTPADAALMVHREWPWLPPLLTTPHRWDALWHSLQNGSAAAIWGNPSDVRKPTSPLRRWTEDDDFGHCLLVLRAKDDKGWVMDPLGSGSYKGQWVPEVQLRRFAFMDADRVRSCAVVRIGGQA